MKRLVLAAALAGLAVPAFAQAPTVEVSRQDLAVIISAYLHPSKIEPGDAFAAIQRIEASAAHPPASPTAASSSKPEVNTPVAPMKPPKD